jgi:hypothetical protein
MRAFCRTAVLVIAGLGVLACGRERPSPKSDSTEGGVPIPSGEVVTPVIKPWDAAIGRVVALWVSDFPDSVMILGPDYVEGRYSDSAVFDLRPLTGVRLDLFSRKAMLGNSVLTGGIYQRSLEGCLTWPTASVAPVIPGWNVGLETGRATSIPLDSAEAMTAADSARFIAQVTRLVSDIPETRDTMFSRVPFFVLRGYWFKTANIDGIIAVVQRSIPSEADPREERVLFIAERPIGSSGEYKVAYVDRAIGGIEAPRSIDLLAAVLLAPSQRPVLIVNYLYNDGASVGFVERTAAGKWDATWESAYAGC